MERFDYIIVGAGSSGCACAARLLHLLPGATIALIESGKDYLAPVSGADATAGATAGAKVGATAGADASTSTPPAHNSDDFSKPDHYPRTWDGPANKNYRTVPQRALQDRQLSVVRAAAVGGCSVVNAMIWMRGFKEDWEGYLPLPMPVAGAGPKKEDSSMDTSIEREFEWLEERIRPVTYEGNIVGKLGVEAAASLGYQEARKDDGSHSDSKSDSLWESPGTSTMLRVALDQHGRRQDVYRALGADDGRITLIKGMAEQLIILSTKHDDESEDDGQIYASGVTIRLEDGSIKSVLTKDEEGCEVIVSCGAIDSPKLLQLSGIGPKALLKKLDIPLILDRPAVGEGLKDHVMHILAFEIPPTTLPDPAEFSPNGINASLYDESLDVQFLFMDGGTTLHHLPYALMEPLREKVPSATIWGRAKDNLALMGTFLLSSTLLTMSTYLPAFRANLQSSGGILVNLMKPFSVGTVMIRSKDPNEAPLIDTKYLEDERDLNTLVKANKIARELMKASPLSDIVGKERTPVQEGDTDERERIKKACMPYHHATGTCSSCVDDQLRFEGIDRLRVADASSLRFHPRVPTNASSMAVGARCASLIAAAGLLRRQGKEGKDEE